MSNLKTHAEGGPSIETEDTITCLQVLPCQIDKGTRLKIATDDGHTHVIDHEPFPYEENGESDFTDLGLGKSRWETTRLKDGSFKVDRYRDGKDTPSSTDIYEPDSPIFHMVRITESTNQEMVNRCGFPIGGFRINTPVIIKMGPFATRLPNIVSIKGTNLREDTSTKSTIALLQEHFGELFDEQVGKVAIPTSEAVIIKESMSPEEVAGVITLIHQKVTAVIAFIFDEIQEGQLYERFSAENLEKIGEELGAFVENYGGYIEGMISVGRKKFRAQTALGKTKEYEIVSSTSPYRGEQIGFSIKPVNKEEKSEPRSRNPLAALFSKLRGKK